MASPSQLQIITDNYGIDKTECVDAIKKLYIEFGLESMYAKQENEYSTGLLGSVRQLRDDYTHELYGYLSADMFEPILHQLSNRQK